MSSSTRTKLAIAASAAGLALTGALLGPVTAEAAAPASSGGGQGDVSTATAVPYLCFVTYQGGSTNVTYTLNFTATAPGQVRLKDGYQARVSLPPITPNPAINTSVRDLRLVLAAPAAAEITDGKLSGGTGLGRPGARLEVRRDAVVLTAAGPFTGGVPFTLPTVEVKLKARSAGSGAIRAAGLGLSDPAFSWVRTDPADGTTERPFACFTDPVALTTTTVS